jgi:hypothetical protein
LVHRVPKVSGGKATPASTTITFSRSAHRKRSPEFTLWIEAKIGQCQ